MNCFRQSSWKLTHCALNILISLLCVFALTSCFGVFLQDDCEPISSLPPGDARWGRYTISFSGVGNMVYNDTLAQNGLLEGTGTASQAKEALRKAKSLTRNNEPDVQCFYANEEKPIKNEQQLKAVVSSGGSMAGSSVPYDSFRGTKWFAIHPESHDLMRLSFDGRTSAPEIWFLNTRDYPGADVPGTKIPFNGVPSLSKVTLYPRSGQVTAKFDNDINVFMQMSRNGKSIFSVIEFHGKKVTSVFRDPSAVTNQQITAMSKDVQKFILAMPEFQTVARQRR